MPSQSPSPLPPPTRAPDDDDDRYKPPGERRDARPDA
jgi:hypothetical protein